jgi:sugar phosphate isomerase/epimerase
MKLSVFTASTPEWTPSQVVDHLRRQGWDGVEWRVTDQDDAAQPGFWAGNRATWPYGTLDDDLEQMLELTRGAGLEFSALGGYRRCDDRAGVERMLTATEHLGARQVRVTTLPLGNTTMGGEEPSGRTYPDLFEETREHVTWAADRATEHGVKALIELHRGTVIASASSAVRLLDGLDPEHVGVIHDVGNLVSEGYEDHLSAFQMLGPYLAHVHVKNTRWTVVGEEGEGVLAGTLRWAPQPAPLRAGQADIAAYIRTLGTAGYDGWLTVEDFSTEVPIAERTADNLAYLRACISAAESEV